MKQTTLNEEELDRRAGEVFLLENDNHVYDFFIDDKGVCHMLMTESGGEIDYQPDMENRPQALSYLLGERNDFND